MIPKQRLERIRTIRIMLEAIANAKPFDRDYRSLALHAIKELDELRAREENLIFCLEEILGTTDPDFD